MALIKRDSIERKKKQLSKHSKSKSIKFENEVKYRRCRRKLLEMMQNGQSNPKEKETFRGAGKKSFRKKLVANQKGKYINWVM